VIWGGRRFPEEFSELLRRPLRLAGEGTLRDGADRLAWFPLALKPEAAAGGIALLDLHNAPLLSPCRSAVPKKSISGMKKNYSEALAKTMSNSSAMLDGRRAAAARRAREIGLTAMRESQSLQECAERVSGFRLTQGPGLQAIRYLESDYVGPHNDHHPEQPHLRNGYVDLQITLTNDAVESRI
jgi:hypothetical protein